jgi:hypothetical protein
MTAEQPRETVAVRRRQRQTLSPVDASAVVVTLGTATGCWLIALHHMKGMDMGVATTLGSFSFFVVAWVSMMAAMMLPGALPAVRRNARERGRLDAAPLFAASYLGVWTLVGLLVYAVYEPHGTVVAGALTIVVGLYELTPLKRGCRLPWQPLRARLRNELRRLKRRTDAAIPGRRCDEHHLDVRRCHLGAGAEAAAAADGDRHSHRPRDPRPRRCDPRCARLDPGPDALHVSTLFAPAVERFAPAALEHPVLTEIATPSVGIEP